MSILIKLFRNIRRRFLSENKPALPADRFSKYLHYDNGKIVLVVIGILFISCESKTNFPDPLAAGWKGQAVCEVLQEDNSIRVLKCTFPPRLVTKNMSMLLILDIPLKEALSESPMIRAHGRLMFLQDMIFTKAQ